MRSTQLFKGKIRIVAFWILLLFFFYSCSVKPFKLVLLPDTQGYSRFYPEIFYAQTKWIADHADSIAFVLQQGDITDNNMEEQWQVAQKTMTMLDDKVAYTIVPGNHDIGENADSRNSELFNKYFSYNKHSKTKSFRGAYAPRKMDNTWYTFKAGGEKWLILSLEFAPRNCVLEWGE